MTEEKKSNRSARVIVVVGLLLVLGGLASVPSASADVGVGIQAAGTTKCVWRNTTPIACVYVLQPGCDAGVSAAGEKFCLA